MAKERKNKRKRTRMEELSDNFNKENIRKPITSEEYNNWKIMLERINKLDETEEQIFDL